MSDKMYLRISEVAEHLAVSRATAYDLIARGVIPSIRLEGRGDRGILRVPACALEKLAHDAMERASDSDENE
jgi:excisionase family DNA binding protein